MNHRTLEPLGGPSMSNSTVEYRPVLGFSGYFVGDDGSVVSYWNNSGRIGITGKQLSPCPTSKGYPAVTLVRDRKKHTKFVHTLVLTAFRGERPRGAVACHNDGCKSNNHLENLRWDTQSGNLSDRDVHGTSLRGEGGSSAKLTETDVVAIRRRLHAGETCRAIAVEYGVSREAVAAIKSRRTWSHVADHSDVIPRPRSNQDDAPIEVRQQQLNLDDLPEKPF